MSKKQEESEIIIPVNKDKTYGIAVEASRLNVTIYTRKLYTEDTSVPMKFNASVGYKFYAKGDYGPWVLASRPYKRDIETALSWVYELMIMDGLEADKDITSLANIVQQAKTDMTETIASLVSSKTI